MANHRFNGIVHEKIVLCGFPSFIAGNSSKSTAGMGAKGQHIGKIEEISFLPKDCFKLV
jgi:hypothetical protein